MKNEKWNVEKKIADFIVGDILIVESNPLNNVKFLHSL